jgi:hypothetical protein
MTVFAVRIEEAYGDPKKSHVFLIDASNANQAKNLAEAKWYELHPQTDIMEGRTMVWEVEKDYANNPSMR